VAAFSAANVNDHLVLPALRDQVPPLRGSGRRRTRVKALVAEKGYDQPTTRSELAAAASRSGFRGVAPETT